MKALSILLFAAVVVADARVSDWLGAAFWVVAAVVFGLLAFGRRPLARWITVTWAVLSVMTVAVLIIRVGFGYTG